MSQSLLVPPYNFPATRFSRTRTQKLTAENYIHLGLGWIGDKGGGLERYQHGICTAHAALGQNITAWVQSRCPIVGDFNYNVQVFASPEESRAAKIAKLHAVAKQRFLTRDFTLVSHHASVSSSLVKSLQDFPHVVHFHGPWADEAAVEGAPWWKTTLQRRQERKAYHSANRIITLSEAFKSLVVERYGVAPEIVHVVPGAIDVAAADPGGSRTAAREQLGWPTNRPIVLTIRRLVKRVGVDVLLESVAQVVRASPTTDLLVLIGGTGPLKEELTSRIESNGLQKHVHMLGFVPDEQLSLAYRAADVSIVPTQALEGFGLVILESLAAGTPCLVTPVGSLPEVMTDLSAQLVLAGHSAADIADGLRGWLSGSLALPHESTCRDYVRSRYDWSVIAPRVLDVYRSAGLSA